MRVSIGAFDPSIPQIGRVFLTSVSDAWSQWLYAGNEGHLLDFASLLLMGAYLQHGLGSREIARGPRA